MQTSFPFLKKRFQISVGSSVCVEPVVWTRAVLTEPTQTLWLTGERQKHLISSRRRDSIININKIIILIKTKPNHVKAPLIAASAYIFLQIYKTTKIGSSFSSFLNISYPNYPMPNFKVIKIPSSAIYLSIITANNIYYRPILLSNISAHRPEYCPWFESLWCCTAFHRSVSACARGNTRPCACGHTHRFVDVCVLGLSSI